MAGDGLAFDVQGADELIVALQELGEVGAESAMEAALKKGLKPMKAAAEALAPRSSDEPSVSGGLRQPLRFSILIRAALSKSQKRKRAKRGQGEFAEVFLGSSAPHAHLVAFGHRQLVSRGPRKGQPPAGKGAKTHVAGKPFLRPAFDSHVQGTLKITGQELGKRVAAVRKRYLKQIQKGKLSRGARLSRLPR